MQPSYSRRKKRKTNPQGRKKRCSATRPRDREREVERETDRERGGRGRGRGNGWRQTGRQNDRQAQTDLRGHKRKVSDTSRSKHQEDAAQPCVFADRATPPSIARTKKQQADNIASRQESRHLMQAPSSRSRQILVAGDARKQLATPWRG